MLNPSACRADETISGRDAPIYAAVGREISRHVLMAAFIRLRYSAVLVRLR
jgi:hypothetical protein